MSDLVVNDRRAFTKDGELREEADQDSAKASPPEGGGAGAAPGYGPDPAYGAAPGADAGPEEGDGPGEGAGANAGGQQFAGELPATFATLVIGLATSAMMQMEGKSPDGGPSPERDLAGAKHYIDILAELERKTKGNLTEEEENLLKTFLYDLRMRFVEISRRA